MPQETVCGDNANKLSKGKHQANERNDFLFNFQYCLHQSQNHSSLIRSDTFNFEQKNLFCILNEYNKNKIMFALILTSSLAVSKFIFNTHFITFAIY